MFPSPFHSFEYPPDTVLSKQYHEAKMLARKGIFTRTSMSQLGKAQAAKAAKTCRRQGFLRLLYHEAKMLARKGIFARPSMSQPGKARAAKAAKTCRRQGFLRLLYHKAKMLACKGIFARTSMSQPGSRAKHGRLKPQRFAAGKDFCDYYTTPHPIYQPKLCSKSSRHPLQKSETDHV